VAAHERAARCAGGAAPVTGVTAPAQRSAGRSSRGHARQNASVIRKVRGAHPGRDTRVRIAAIPVLTRMPVRRRSRFARHAPYDAHSGAAAKGGTISGMSPQKRIRPAGSGAPQVRAPRAAWASPVGAGTGRIARGESRRLKRELKSRAAVGQNFVTKRFVARCGVPASLGQAARL